MARKRSPHLTDAELRLMEVLWEKGPSTVSEVVERVVSPAPLAYWLPTCSQVLPSGHPAPAAWPVPERPSAQSSSAGQTMEQTRRPASSSAPALRRCQQSFRRL